MSEEESAIQVVENPAGETAAQETAPAEQLAEQPQETTSAQVESGSNKPQVPEAPRRRPSDYYRERQTIRELKETVSMLKQRMEEKAVLKEEKTVAPEVPDFDPAHFSPEHKRILAAREKALRDAYDTKISALEQRVNGWQENQAQAESSRKQQEALEKLFPKSSPDSKETLEQRIQKDPERAMRIKELLIDSGLNELSKTNPEKAVKYALMELGEISKPNPTVLKKSMMGGNGTGNPAMGNRGGNGEQDLMSEKNKINTQLDANPALRFDEKFMARRAQVLSDIERLVTKK